MDHAEASAILRPMQPVYLSVMDEDRALRERIVALDGTVEWVPMPLGKPYDGAWRMAARARLRNCRGVIIVAGEASEQSDHQQWIARCAYTDKRPTLLVAATPPAKLPRHFASWPLTPLTDDAVTAFLATLKASA